jgi:hypothetical protein
MTISRKPEIPQHGFACVNLVCMPNDTATPNAAWIAALANLVVAIIAAVATITAAFIQVHNATKPIAPIAVQQAQAPNPSHKPEGSAGQASIPSAAQKNHPNRPSSGSVSRPFENARLSALEAAVQRLQEARSRDLADEKTRLSAVQAGLAKAQRLSVWISIGSALVALGLIPLSIRNFLSADQARQAAQRYIERWNSPAFEDRKGDLRLFFSGMKAAEQMRESLLSILSFFEEIALAVASHSADERMLQRFFGTSLLHIYDRASPFIHELRAGSNQYALFLGACRR